MFDIQSINFDMVIETVKNAAKLYKDDSAASHITQKGTADYVTEVDTTVQKMICDKLAALYPDIQFMGEEKDNSDIDFSRPVWILDPVDGTTNLLHRYPASVVSLGLAADHQVIAGIIYNPYHDELFFARKGMGAFLNGTPIHVGTSDCLQKSLVAVGTTPYYHEHTDRVFARIKEIFLHVQDIRWTGSAAEELANVACGRTDGYCELILKPWDYAAGLLLVQEAGGKVTDYEGNKITPDHNSSVLATNGNIQNELRALICKY